MNRYNHETPSASPRAERTSLPVELHREQGVSAEVRTQPGADSRRQHEPREQVDIQIPREGQTTTRRPTMLYTAVLCVLLAVALVAVFAPTVGRAVSALEAEGRLSLPSVGRAIGGALLRAGLPPTGGSLLGGLTGESSDTVGGTDTAGEPFGGADTSPGTGTGTAAPETESTDLPAEQDTDPAVSPSESTPSEETGEPDTEEPATAPSDTETSSASSESSLETDAGTDPAPDTEPADTGAGTEPSEKVPEGCFPFASLDMSEMARGAGYIINTAGNLPQSLPTGRLWSTEGQPAVLIINTHPYEGYSDGGAWYDPATGGLAQTDSVNAPDGVVALGAQLARYLRKQGITVIHLRVAVSAGETASQIYERTADLVDYYCRLYPDIGLILDLRRTAELVDGAAVLRTEGQYDGDPCAQLRISVSAGRTREAVARDLAVALALRAGLWTMEPSLSRPVLAKSGTGIAPARTNIVTLTLEVGSAGNTFAEAERLMTPLGRVLTALITETDKKSS